MFRGCTATAADYAATCLDQSLHSDGHVRRRLTERDLPLYQLGQACIGMNEKRSVSEVASRTTEDLIDCYVSDVWHTDHWYGELSLSDGNW